MAVWRRHLKKLVLPPGGLALTAVTGWLLYAAGIERVGLTLAALSSLALYLLGAPLCARRLLRSLDRFPPLDPTSSEARDAGAIVILDAGRQLASLEHGGDSVSPRTLERLTAGAAVYRRLGLPILVSGDGARELMAETLDQSFGVPVRWIERESRDTRENALFSARLLRTAGIDRVVLVTHFWHMPRAVDAFRRAELGVTPAPTGFVDRLRSESGFMALIPTARGLLSTYLALHEWIGILWYKIRSSGSDTQK